MKRVFDIRIFLACMLIVYLIAFFGSIFTSDSVNSDWYQSIRPAMTPPNWVFPIAWTILFFLIGLSMYLAWMSGDKNKRKIVIIVFTVNLILNLIWSFFYFRLQNPLLGFIDIILILASIVWMIASLRKINKTSSLLLVPYLLWVCFAAVLNYLSI